MPTRSTITAKCTDGKWRAIYCQWDGYLKGVGATLLANYNTQKQVEALIAQGDHAIIEKERSLSYFELWNDPIHITKAGTYTECRELRGFEEFDYVWDGVRWSEVNNPAWNALPVSPWISVTECMPEKNQFILAFGSGIGQSVGGPNVDICLWGGTELTSETNFTHWQAIYLPDGTRL